MYLPSVITHFHFKVFIVNVCVLEYIVCMANINNLLFSISQYKSSQKVFTGFYISMLQALICDKEQIL